MSPKTESAAATWIMVACALLFVAGAFATCAHKARAEDAPKDPRLACPAGAPSCKILLITPPEEQALIAPNGILATAAAARKLDLGDIASYFAKRLAEAPAGDPQKLPAPELTPNK